MLLAAIIIFLIFSHWLVSQVIVLIPMVIISSLKFFLWLSLWISIGLLLSWFLED